ncbi:hypothetical protein [Sporomusa acidovorans]|nr:hypothetical protein [Sporomusa acidovorans]
MAKLHELESALGSLRDEAGEVDAQDAVQVLFKDYPATRLAGWLEQEVSN